MELWIRSQSKLKLTKVDYLYVDKLNAYDLDNRCEVRTGDLNLGIYKTKERALEVLDIIQKGIKDCFNLGIKEIIYEMPKE